MMFKQILLVGLGGGAGSILRYLTALLCAKCNSGAFPLATFTVNIAGCLLAGIFIGLFAKHNATAADLRLLLLTGFCGGYTTFSAFSAENFQLFGSGNYFVLALYILSSVFLGIAALWLGQKIIL